jgi:hypothetical protein
MLAGPPGLVYHGTIADLEVSAHGDTLGSQGFWGLIISAVALPLVTMIKDSNGVPLDDAIGAWHEVAASWQLQASIIASIISVRPVHWLTVHYLTGGTANWFPAIAPPGISPWPILYRSPSSTSSASQSQRSSVVRREQPLMLRGRSSCGASLCWCTGSASMRCR